MSAPTHLTEAVWFNAKRTLPDSFRRVLVVFRHFIAGNAAEMRLSEARFTTSNMRWDVESKDYKPSVDIITQWAEIDPLRGGFLPDDFPNEQHGYEFVSNKR